MEGVEFITSPGGHFDLILVSLPNAPSILGRDSSLPIENLSIARLAADAASYGLRVGVCDGDELDFSLEETRGLVLSCTCSLIGLTSYQSNIVESLCLIADYKLKHPSATTCMGGYQATFTAEELLANEPYLDTVVVGRGERILPRLVYTAGAGGAPRGVFSNSRLEESTLLTPPNKSSQQPAAWLARHWPAVKERRAAAMITSEGCISNCSFCATPFFERLERGFPWKPRSAEDVVDEILHLQSSAGVASVHFHDPDFLGLTPVAWERARRIAKLLEQAGFSGRVRFTAQARAIAALPIDFWRLWKSIGLERVFVGLESGADSVLVHCRKSSRVRDNIEATSKLRQAAIAIQSGFIMFTPDTTAEDVLANLDFLVTVEQDHFVRSYTNELKVYPGTRYFDCYKERGLLTFDRTYLALGLRYVDSTVSAMREGLADLAVIGFPLDRFLRDLEFGITAGDTTILTEFGLLCNGERLRGLYDQLRSERRKRWQAWFRRALVSKPFSIRSSASDLRTFETDTWCHVTEAVKRLPRPCTFVEEAILEVL